MKTAENMEIVKLVPMERLMVETDCPYCDIRNSHHSAQHVKTIFPKKDKTKYNPESEEIAIVRDRNEPCTIVQVVEVLAALKGVTKEEISRVSFENTLQMFGLVWSSLFVKFLDRNLIFDVSLRLVKAAYCSFNAAHHGKLKLKNLFKS